MTAADKLKAAQQQRGITPGSVPEAPESAQETRGSSPPASTAVAPSVSQRPHSGGVAGVTGAPIEVAHLPRLLVIWQWAPDRLRYLELWEGRNESTGGIFCAATARRYREQHQMQS